MTYSLYSVLLTFLLVVLDPNVIFLGHLSCFGKGLYFYSFKCHTHLLIYPINTRKSSDNLGNPITYCLWTLPEVEEGPRKTLKRTSFIWGEKYFLICKTTDIERCYWKGQRGTPCLKERALTKEVFEEKELTNPGRTHTQILKNNCKHWGETQKMSGESWLFYHLNMSIFHAKAKRVCT